MNSPLVRKPRRHPIAKQLSEKLGGNWRAVRNGFGWYWVCSDGREVRKYAEGVLDYDGYSDSEFYTVYYDKGGKRVGSHGLIY